MSSLFELYQNNAEFLNGAGSAASLIAFAIGLLQLLAKRRKGLRVYRRKTSLVNEVDNSGIKCEVSGPEGSSSSLAVSEYLISNHSGKTITDDDFVDAPQLAMAGIKLIKVEITHPKDSEAQFRVSEQTIEVTGLKLRNEDADRLSDPLIRHSRSSHPS